MKFERFFIYWLEQEDRLVGCFKNDLQVAVVLIGFAFLTSTATPQRAAHLYVHPAAPGQSRAGRCTPTGACGARAGTPVSPARYTGTIGVPVFRVPVRNFTGLVLGCIEAKCFKY